MKRSEINQIMRDAIAFMAEHHFILPRFAYWTPDDWRSRGPEARQIVEHQLGWDITDCGSGDFAKVGLFLFTIRNGTLADIDDPGGKSYAEKIMIVREQQFTPIHRHNMKMEDIINRGGGELEIQLWNATDDDDRGDDDVTVFIDGVETIVPAGGTVVLEPGDSVNLAQRHWHAFWGVKGKGTVLVGEVSRVNDDRVDNVFYEPVSRFPDIEEDEPPLYPLVTDYPDVYAHA